MKEFAELSRLMDEVAAKEIVYRAAHEHRDAAQSAAGRAWNELVNAEAKREAAYVSGLTGTGVRGMGNAPVQVDEAEAKRIAEAKKADDADAEDVFKRFGLSEAAAKAAANGRAA